MVKHDYRKTKRETLCKILDIDFINMDEEKVWQKIYDRMEGKVKVMFIAESPPKEYTQKNKENWKNYFYYVDESGSGIQKNIIGNLLTPLGIKDMGRENKQKRLVNFIKNENYLLTDLFYEPISRITTKEDVDNNYNTLKKEIKNLKPNKVVMMLTVKSINKKVVNDYFEKKIGITYKEEGNFIKKQNMVCKKLKGECDLNFKFKIAPFPGQGISPEWCKLTVSSFSDWVENYPDKPDDNYEINIEDNENGDKIKDWLEIDCKK